MQQTGIVALFLMLTAVGDSGSVAAGAMHLKMPFIIDLFALCFVGDPREEVVRLVTPPSLRDRLVGTGGLPADPFRGFAVRHFWKIEHSAREQ